MKKLLALVLALVMTLSLCITSNAAYADAADIDYTEAVDVMSAIGVLQGDGTNFNPDGILTRAEACTIIAKMLGMGTYDGKSNFTDCQGHWGEGAIALCAGEGIVDGVGGGKFDPNGKLTGYAFAKMLLVALGYDAKIEGMTGSDWTIGVAKLIKSLDLNDGIDGFVGSAEVSREIAAQMALNALQCAEVTYSQTESVTNKGEITTSTALKASKVEGSNPATDPYLELMEDYFPKLVKTNAAATADDFGRPATKWAYKGVSIGTYANEATYTYTADQDTKDGKAAIKADLKDYTNYDKSAGNAKLADGTTIVQTYVNGKNANADTQLDAIAGLTGNGRVVEIYVEDNYITRIVVTDTVLAKVKSIDAAAGTVTYTAQFGATTTDFAATTKGYGKVAKDDYVLVTAVDSNDGTIDTTNSTIKTVTPATKVTGIATTKNTANGTITVAGTSYEEAATVLTASDVANFGVSPKYDATLYLDTYGYIVKAVGGAAAATDKAVAVLKSYQSLNKDGALVFMIEGVTSNGETVNWEVESVTGHDPITATGDVDTNTVYTYADADSDDSYELSTATGVTTFGNSTASSSKTVYRTAQTIASTQKSMNATGTAYFADNVKFIFVNNGKAVVRDGVQKVASAATMYATEYKNAADGKYYINAVYVLAAAPSSAAATGDVVFVAGATGATSVINSKTNKVEDFTTYDAYIDGKEVKNFYAAAGAVSGFYYAKVDADNGAYVLTGNAYVATEGKMAVLEDMTVTAFAGNVITTASGDFDLTNATIVNKKTGATITNAEEIAGATNVNVSVMYDVATNNVSYIYVMPTVNVTLAQTLSNGLTYQYKINGVNKAAGTYAVNVNDVITCVVSNASGGALNAKFTFVAAKLTSAVTSGADVAVANGASVTKTFTVVTADTLTLADGT